MKCESCGRDGFTRLSQHLALSDCEYPKLTKYQKDIVIGTLMGDATIVHDTASAKNAQYILRVIKDEYLLYVTRQMPDWFISEDSLVMKDDAQSSFEKSGFSPERRGSVENYSDYYGIHSKRHPYLTHLRGKWYDDGDKVFPDDIDLTPTVLKHWYVNDGNLKQNSNNYYRAVFNSVNESHRPEFIMDILDDVGYDARFDGDHKFRLVGDSTRQFFKDIGEPVPGFSYKWPEYDE